MNYKKLLLIMISVFSVVGLLTGSVAYYRTTYEGRLIASTGNAVFNVTGLSDDGVNKTIDLGSKLLPGDSGEFSITLDSTGSTVDMYATLKIDRKVLPDSLKFYSTPDHKSEIKTYYSFLEVSGTKSETITIYWFWNPFTNEEDDNKYIGKELSADISISVVQISEYAMMKNGYSSKVAFWSDTYKPYIRTINFGNDLSNLPSSCTEENLCWDISYNTTQKKKVYGYLIDSGLKDSTDTTKSLYNLYIVSEVPIFAPNSCYFIFNDFKNLVQIDFINNFNTSKVTDMSHMFYDCSSLTSLDLSNFSTSNVARMNSMFSGCSSLTNLDLSNFNTSKVTDMSAMFSVCSSLAVLYLTSFNTSKVTNMGSMFNKCTSLTSIDLSSFNTSNVTNMWGMFFWGFSLMSLDLNNFNTSKVTDMGSMFNFCKQLTSLDLSSFNTLNVTNMRMMFMSCSSLTSLDLGNFNTTNVTDMNNMFYGCAKLQAEITITGTSITNYSSVFGSALTDANAYVIINYVSGAETIAQGMKSTASSENQSKITLKQI